MSNSSSVASNLKLIVARDIKGGIGLDNKLPWHIPTDMRFFKEKTIGHHVIMGRKTFQSVRLLHGRHSIILTNNRDFKISNNHEGRTSSVVHSIEEAIELVGSEKAFIIGGAEIYKQALPFVSTIYDTVINQNYHCDTFFNFDLSKWTVSEFKEHKVDMQDLDFSMMKLIRRE